MKKLPDYVKVVKSDSVTFSRLHPGNDPYTSYPSCTSVCVKDGNAVIIYETLVDISESIECTEREYQAAAKKTLKSVYA